MKALLLRSGSVPKHMQALSDSPNLRLSRRNSISGGKMTVTSPNITMHLEINRHKNAPIRRTVSEADIIGSETGLERLSRTGCQSFPARILEEDYLLGAEVDDDYGCLNMKHTGIWPEKRIPLEELGFTGDGFGKGMKSGGGDGGDHGNNRDDGSEHGDLSKIGDYYKEMIKSNPSDSLLLRNYGKFLLEVEGDMEKAEEYYGRAILASPGDGEVLSLYGKLIWDSQRDSERARTYFDQAVSASPNDCMVMGSYAQFMWEAEEDDDEEEEINGKAQASPAMVAVL